jgi:hypothetical protein
MSRKGNEKDEEDIDFHRPMFSECEDAPAAASGESPVITSEIGIRYRTETGGIEEDSMSFVGALSMADIERVISEKPDSASPPQLNTEHQQQIPQQRYNEEWVRYLHEEIQEEVQREGIHACKWGRILDKWQEHISDAPYEDVPVACAKQILQHARLTSASASPMFYETLRKLGKDLLVKQEHDEKLWQASLQNLRERLYPSAKDTEWYEGFFGDRDTWTLPYIARHLEHLHCSHDIKSDEMQEQQLGFILAHVKSNRYNAVEMQAIIKVCKIVRVAMPCMPY